MAVEVVATTEFESWFMELDDQTAQDVAVAVDVLEMTGPTLGFPRSSALKGPAHPLRELRVQSHGRPIRVVYAFDPAHRAVLLLGGIKTGSKSFYKTLIAQAERLWLQYLRERDRGEEDE